MTDVINFGDIIKKKFLDGIGGNYITVTQVLVTLILTFALGLFIVYIYRRTSKNVMYNKNFSLSLIMLSMVTAMIIMPVTSNLTLSLGMVGALSIVRFRAAVKDPLDIVFMFWAIASGITVGARFYTAAVFATLLIGLLLCLYASKSFGSKGAKPYLLIVHHNDDSSRAVNSKIKSIPGHSLKSKTITRDTIEVTIEVKLHEENSSIVNELMAIEGVRDAALISYNGEQMQ